MKSPSQNWLNITSLRNFIHLRLVLSNGRASQIVGRGKGEMWHVGGWWENKLFWWRRRTDQWPGWWSPPWTSISRSLMQVSIHVPLVHTSIQIICIHIKMSLVGEEWQGYGNVSDYESMTMMMMTAQYNSVQSCHPGPCYKSLWAEKGNEKAPSCTWDVDTNFNRMNCPTNRFFNESIEE